MKRLFAVLAVVLVLAGIALSAGADPIGVGGSITASSASSSDLGFPGKGVPQGKPFGGLMECTLTPIGVGGS